MRAQLDQSVAGYRLLKRYHKLRTPLIDLTQLILDSMPNGMIPGETITIKQEDGAISVMCDIKPITLVIEDGERKFVLKIFNVHKAKH